MDLPSHNLLTGLRSASVSDKAFLGIRQNPFSPTGSGSATLIYTIVTIERNVFLKKLRIVATSNNKNAVFFTNSEAFGRHAACIYTLACPLAPQCTLYTVYSIYVQYIL